MEIVVLFIRNSYRECEGDYGGNDDDGDDDSDDDDGDDLLMML